MSSIAQERHYPVVDAIRYGQLSQLLCEIGMCDRIRSFANVKGNHVDVLIIFEELLQFSLLLIKLSG